MSMIEYLPLTPELARELASASEPGLVLPLGAELWAAAAAKGPGLNFAGRATFGMRQGEIIGAGGVIPDLEPRAVAWFIIEPLLPARMLVEARRKCAEVIVAAHAQGWRRIEAHVHERFPRGCRLPSASASSSRAIPRAGCRMRPACSTSPASIRLCRRGCSNDQTEVLRLRLSVLRSGDADEPALEAVLRAVSNFT